MEGRRLLPLILPLLPLLLLHTVVAYAAVKPSRILITFLNSDGSRAFFYGALHVEVRSSYGLPEWRDFEVHGGVADVAVGYSMPDSILRCMLSTECIAKHSTLKIYVEPGDMFPATLEYKLKELNANITERLVGSTLYVNITLPMKLNTARVCVYTMRHAPIPGAEVRSDGGTRKTGQNGCTGKPILISSNHKLAVAWGGKLWPIPIKDEYFKTRRVNITLPVPWGEKFNLTILSGNGKPVLVFVLHAESRYAELCNATCTFTLDDIGRAEIWPRPTRPLKPYVLSLKDVIIDNNTLVVKWLGKSFPFRLCAYDDAGNPLNIAVWFASVSGMSIEGKGCISFYMLEPMNVLHVEVRRGRKAAFLELQVPGNYTKYIDLTPPVIARAWINASWTTFYGTKCLDTLLYVQAYDPNKWASGVREVRAGFSKDFYDLTEGDYLGNNTWRIELGCPRHTGAIRTVYVAAVDKAGNRVMVNLTYREEPGVKWLLGTPTTKTTATKTAKATTTTATHTATTQFMEATTTATTTTSTTTITETATASKEKSTFQPYMLLLAIAAIALLATILITRRKTT